MIVCGDAVPGDLGQDGGAPRFRSVHILQRQDGRPFAQDHPSPLAIERPASIGRRGLERIESNKNKLRDRVVAAGQDALVAAGTDALEGVPDGVRA
jgi:hypothetical protein